MVAIPAAVMIGLSVASAAAGAVSAVSSANAQSTQAKQAAINANYQAQVTAKNASAEQAQQQAQADQQEQENNARLGSIRALYGASGVDASGSVMDVLSGNAQQMAYQQNWQNYDETLRQQGYSEEEAGDEAQASADMQQARNAQTAGYMGVGTSILSSASSFAGSKTGQSLLAGAG